MRRSPGIIGGAALVAAVSVAITGPALAGDPGFKTSQASMLTPVMPGMTVAPLLTVGDGLSSGYRFEAIPDGISVRTRGHGRVDLYVNHETSKVPFPYNAAAPTAANGENDFDNAQVSRLMLSQHSAGVLQRCVRHPERVGLPAVLLELPGDVRRRGSTGRSSSRTRRSPDYVFRQEASWPPPIGSAAERRPASSSRSTSGPAGSTRSTAWAATTTRTPSRSPGTESRWSCRATTRSRAVRSRASFPAGRGSGPVPALLLHRIEHEVAAGRQRAISGPSSPTRRA